MAEARIKFSLFSTFDRKGFNQAESLVKSTGEKGKQAAEALGSVATEASKLGGTLGAVVGSVDTLIKSFAAFGVVGAIVGGIKAGIDIASQYFMDKSDELVKFTTDAAQKATNRLKSIVSESISALDKSFDKSINKINEYISSVKSANTDIAKVSSAVNESTTAEQNAKLAQLRLDKMNAMIAAEDEASRKLIEAKYNVMIAEEQHLATIMDGNIRLHDANVALTNAKEIQKLQSEAVSEAEKHLQLAIEEEERSKVLSADEQKKFTQKRIEAEKALQKAQHALASAETDVTVAEEKLKTVTYNIAQKRSEAQIQLNSAMDAEKRLKSSTEKLADEREKSAEEEARKKELEKQLNEQLKKAEAALNVTVEKENDAVKKAEKNLDHVKQLLKNNDVGMNAAQMFNPDFGGGKDFQMNQQGGMADFAEWQNAQRYKGRVDRNQERADRASRDGQRQLADLEKRLNDGEKLSKRDEDKLKQLRDWDKQRRGEKDAQKALEEAQKKRDENIAKMTEAVEEIKDQIKELGVK